MIEALQYEFMRNALVATVLVGIACGLFISSIHHMGLVTLTHTPQPMRFLNEILGRPKNERPFILFPVGYPAADCRVPAITKKPFDEITSWIE